MRVPVSNLVRNILEDAVGGTRPLPSPGDTPLDAVYGWQSLTLNHLVPCERCRTELSAGEKAYLGLSDRQQRRVFVCGGCLPRPSATPGHDVAHDSGNWAKPVAVKE